MEGLRSQMLDALIEIEAEIPTMKWQSVAGPNDTLAHFTGRGARWVIQLVCLDEKTRMGAASGGSTMIKLTDELAEKAEAAARKDLERP